jgi:hypothetical protein
MSVPQASAESWRQRVFRVTWARLAVRGSAGYVFAWGAVALVGRGVRGESSPGWWWGAAGLAVVVAAAGVVAWRRRPTVERAVALLDRENRFGGLLMASQAEGWTPWAARTAEARLPRLRWRGGPSFGALAAAAVFTLACLLVPMPGPAGAQAAMDVSRSVAQLQQQVEVLEDENLLESPEADRVREALDRIEQDAKGEAPSKTWEALDHLADRVEQAADESVELAERRMTESSAAAALAEALKQGGDTLDPAQRGAAMSALSELTQRALGEPTLDGMQLPEGLAEALGEAGLDASSLSPELLEQLAEMMQGREAELQEMMEALAEAGLCENPGSGSGELVEIDPSELLDWLAEAGNGECEAAAVLKVCAGVGRGGINRGPGHAEMVWGDPSSKENVSFDPEVLPPARLKEMRDAQMIGTSRGTPQPEDDATGSAGGALTNTRAGGGSAAVTTVLPRHRGTVQRYFERDAP